MDAAVEAQVLRVPCPAIPASRTSAARSEVDETRELKAAVPVAVRRELHRTIPPQRPPDRVEAAEGGDAVVVEILALGGGAQGGDDKEPMVQHAA